MKSVKLVILRSLQSINFIKAKKNKKYSKTRKLEHVLYVVSFTYIFTNIIAIHVSYRYSGSFLLTLQLLHTYSTRFQTKLLTNEGCSPLSFRKKYCNYNVMPITHSIESDF